MAARTLFIILCLAAATLHPAGGALADAVDRLLADRDQAA